MRLKTAPRTYLDIVLPSSPTKVVAAYRKKYGAMNALLLSNPAVLRYTSNEKKISSGTPEMPDRRRN